MYIAISIWYNIIVKKTQRAKAQNKKGKVKIMEMTVISSQRFRSDEIVEEKIENLISSEETTVVVPVVRAYTKDLEGNELYIMVDKHHTLEAARELELNVEFKEIEDDLAYYKDIEEQNGEAICEAHWMDSNWYYINCMNEDMIGVDVW